MTQKIISYLDELFSNPQCELNYSKDYELLIAVMLSAQTTDKRVNAVTSILFKKYDSLEKLSNAEIQDIIDIIRPIGTFNKKARNIISISKALLNDCEGKVPNNRFYLEKLDGVGRKTANVVLSNLYNVPCIAVDTHVARVSKRIGLAKASDDVLMIENKLNNAFSGTQLIKLHHQLVLFGRYYCKAKKPMCNECKLKTICSYEKSKENF